MTGALRRGIGWALVAALLVLSFVLALAVQPVEPAGVGDGVVTSSRVVQRLWAGAQAGVREARDLAAAGDRDGAIAVLDAEIAMRAAGGRDVRAHERGRLSFERAALLDDREERSHAEQYFPSVLVDARVDGVWTSLAPEGIVVGLLAETPAGEAATPYVRAVVSSADLELPLVVDAFVLGGFAVPEALVAALAVFEQTPPGTTATDGLRGMLGDDWPAQALEFERIARDEGRSARERTLAAWCLREVADLPVALLPRWYMYKGAANGFDRERVLRAWEPVRDLRGDAAFLARLEIAIEALVDTLPNAGAVDPHRERTAATVQWLDRHLGRAWRSEPLVRSDVDRLRALVASLEGAELAARLAELAGVRSDAPPESLAARMTDYPDDVGVLDQLLRCRVPAGVVSPLRCASQRVGPLSVAWHEALALPKEHRRVHAVWLRIDGARWRARGRIDSSIVEGAGENITLSQLRPWERRNNRVHRIPGTPIRRRERPRDRVSCRLDVNRDAHGVWLHAWGARIESRRSDMDRKKFPDARVVDVPRLLPPGGQGPLSDTCLLVWMDAAEARAGDARGEPWRDAITCALERLADALPSNRHRRRDAYLSALDVAARIPMPEARDALRRLALQDGPFEVASSLLIRALVLAGDEALLLDPSRSDLAEGNRLAHLSEALDTADPIFWAQVLTRTESPRVKSIATGHLTSLTVDIDGALARVLLAAERAHPETVPFVLLGPALESGEDRYGPTRRQKRAGIIALLLLVGAGLALRRIRRIVREGGEAPRSALALLVVGVCFAITDVHLGPVDLFPDAGGFLIAAGALALLGAPLQSRGARIGAWAFVVAAGISLLADLATIVGLSWPVLDSLSAVACAVGVVSLAPLAADLLRDFEEPRGANPRVPHRPTAWRIYATAIGLALVGSAASGILFLLFSLQGAPPGAFEPVVGGALLTWLAIVAALASWQVWRIGLRRGSDVTPLPMLFVLAYGVFVTVQAAIALRGTVDVEINPAWWGEAAIGVTALVWCALRLTDAVRIRQRGLLPASRRT